MARATPNISSLKINNGCLLALNFITNKNTISVDNYNKNLQIM